MPGWQAVSFDKPAVAIEAKPRSWWRKGLLQLAPYLYGSKPKFRLTVTARADLPQPEPLYWFLKFSNSDQTGHQLLLPVMQMNQSIIVDVGDRLLGFTGDTTLGVTTCHNPESYHTLYSFRAMVVEDLVRDVFLGVLLGVLAFVLGLCNR